MAVTVENNTNENTTTANAQQPTNQAVEATEAEQPMWKTALKVGAVVTAVAVVGYGAYRWYTSGSEEVVAETVEGLMTINCAEGVQAL